MLLTLLTLTLTGTAQASIEQRIRHAFPDDPDTAVCIAQHESTLNPRATFAGNLGLFQINWSSHRYFSPARLLTASYNIAAARHVYLDARARWGNGWLPWSTRGMCGA